MAAQSSLLSGVVFRATIGLPVCRQCYGEHIFHERNIHTFSALYTQCLPVYTCRCPWLAREAFPAGPRQSSSAEESIWVSRTRSLGDQTPGG